MLVTKMIPYFLATFWMFGFCDKLSSLLRLYDRTEHQLLPIGELNEHMVQKETSDEAHRSPSSGDEAHRSPTSDETISFKSSDEEENLDGWPAGGDIN